MTKPSHNAVKIKRDMRILDTLFKMAEVTEPVSEHRIAAAIVRGNEIVSFGRNSMKTHPLQRRFGKNPEAVCLHAEIDAIKNALRRISLEDLSKATLYVARYRKFKKTDRSKPVPIWGLAKPCSGCMAAVDAFDIPRVVYTCDGIGNYEELP